MKRIIPRYAGSKASYCFSDGQSYGAIIEPFAGAASTTFRMWNKFDQVFWGEADASLRAIYQCWLNGQHREVEGWVKSWQFRFADADLMETENLWADIKFILYKGECRSFTLSCVAAASLIARKLTFSGIIRCSSNGSLNIKYCPGQINLLSDWVFRYPKTSTNHIYLFNDWSNALEMFYCHRVEKDGICVIDPPYYADRSIGTTRMTAAYPGHKPHEISTLKLCLDALEMAMMMSLKIKRIVVCNYYSPGLEKGVMRLCERYNFSPPKTFYTGRLDRCQNHGKKKSNYEGVNYDWGSSEDWIFGKAAKQLQLVVA